MSLSVAVPTLTPKPVGDPSRQMAPSTGTQLQVSGVSVLVVNGPDPPPSTPASGVAGAPPASLVEGPASPVAVSVLELPQPRSVRAMA